MSSWCSISLSRLVLRQLTSTFFFFCWDNTLPHPSQHTRNTHEQKKKKEWPPWQAPHDFPINRRTHRHRFYLHVLLFFTSRTPTSPTLSWTGGSWTGLGNSAGEEGSHNGEGLRKWVFFLSPCFFFFFFFLFQYWWYATIKREQRVGRDKIIRWITKYCEISIARILDISVYHIYTNWKYTYRYHIRNYTSGSHHILICGKYNIWSYIVYINYISDSHFIILLCGNKVILSIVPSQPF